MRLQLALGFTAMTAISILFGYGVAGAQQPELLPGPPDATAGFGRQVTLSPAEQLAQTEGYLARMEQARQTIRRMLETARSQRDVVKTLCLNDKLNQMDVAIRSARERRQALEVAANRKDVDLANHEFTILNVLRQRTDQLSAEANLCIGKEIEDIGKSDVTSSIDPGMPEEDPSEYPYPPIIVEPPVCTSCFQ